MYCLEERCCRAATGRTSNENAWVRLTQRGSRGGGHGAWLRMSHRSSDTRGQHHPTEQGGPQSSDSPVLLTP